METETRKLSKAIIGEIFLALGFQKHGMANKVFGPIFYKAADRFSKIAVQADHLIADEGFSKAAEWMCSHWCSEIISHGESTIPENGPLLILSNHAGTYDSLILSAKAMRSDLIIIASDVPFLKSLPNGSKHLIFLSDDPKDRMVAARAGIQHLKSGGALLLFGTGLIDPDPAVYPDAETWIEKWLPSIDLFLRAEPKALVVLSIVSGILAPKWAKHPITWLKRIDWQKRRLAEFGQVLQQLFKPGSLYVHPRVSFSEPVTYQVLRNESNTDRVLPAVISRGKNLLKDHCQRYGICAILETSEMQAGR